MFYGYLSMRKPEALLNEIYIVTMPCETMQEAEEEFKKAEKSIPRDVYLDYFWGNQNGIVETKEKIIFQKEKLGIRVNICSY